MTALQPPLADRCPGLLRPHQAADGALVRIRLPGGRVPADAFGAAAAAAARYGDGDLTLTGRANLQIRGIALDLDGEAPQGLVSELRAAGLLPSDSHERVRNLICSPLTGIAGGFADLRPVVGELDAMLCADPALADLSGRFLFVLDDGRGDLWDLRADLGIIVTAVDLAQLRIGELAGPTVQLRAAAQALVMLAHRFLGIAEGRWHVRELPGGGTELGGLQIADRSPAGPAGCLVGISDQPDGTATMVALAPLGLVDPARAAAAVSTAREGSGALTVTPWRSMVIPGIPRPALADVRDEMIASGWVLDADSGWAGVTACTGAPGCGHAAGGTRPLATAVAAQRVSTDLPVHVVACERRCGAPIGRHRELMVTR